MKLGAHQGRRNSKYPFHGEDMEDTLVSYQFDGKTFRKEVAPDSADKVARQISEAFGQAVIEYYDAVTGDIVYASLFEEGRKTSH